MLMMIVSKNCNMYHAKHITYPGNHYRHIYVTSCLMQQVPRKETQLTIRSILAYNMYGVCGAVGDPAPHSTIYSIMLVL